MNDLRVPHIGPSPGGVESPVTQLVVQTCHHLTTEEWREIDISDSLVRDALGIEDPDGLLAPARR